MLLNNLNIKTQIGLLHNIERMVDLWTKSEDIHLMELVEEYGVKNWSRIAQ